MISFGVKYWFLLLPVIAVAAAGIVLLLYFKNEENRELTVTQRRILMGLRFLSFCLIAFMLLSPFFRSLKRIVQNPVVITAWDNSGSVVATGDSTLLAEETIGIKNRISQGLESRYSLVNYTFGEETKLSGELDFSEKKSDYSDLISTISNNHFNENVGAVVIAGDGIYNQGKNPLNMLGNLTFPVFTIALGDTTEVTDALIRGTRVNRTSFSGNRFPVEIDAHFLKLKGNPLKLTVYEKDREIAQTVITPPNDDYFNTLEFIIEAGAPGLKQYTATIEKAKDEQNTKNNTVSFVVNVLESKQKILILSDGPHPDIGAIKYTLEQQKSYEVSAFTEEPYPSNFQDFNLIILNQLPTSGKSLANIAGGNVSHRIPVLFIVGGKTFLPQLNTLSAGVQINPLAGSGEEAQAVINPAYSTFNLSENLREAVPKFPPLLVPFANYRLEPEFNVLLFQRVKNIDTGKPLIATGIQNGKKTGFIFGEGIWRWRLNDFFQNQNHNHFNELVNQLVQYLALRQNEDNFMIDYEPEYAETENVILKAEVYNDAFERITNEEVNIDIKNENGDEFHFIFDVRGDSYYLNTGNLPAGNYTFDAEVSIGEETHTEHGNFAVSAVNLENMVTRANHRMLFQLASQTGGAFYTPGEIDEIINQIKNSDSLKPVSYFQDMISELLNMHRILIVIIILLSVEWFLRRYWGIY